MKNFNICLVSPPRWGEKEKLNLFLNKFNDCGLTISGVMIEKDENTTNFLFISGSKNGYAIFEKLTEILLISFQNRRILKHLPQKLTQ